MAFLFFLMLHHAPIVFATILKQLPVALTASSRRQSATTTALSADEIASFRPYTFYASAGYCQPAQTLVWICGATCDANPTFQPVASGGDGTNVQFWYVGYDPTLQSVIVGHQGTDPVKLFPLITDADVFLQPLDQSLFPGVDASIQVHNGFQAEHAKTAFPILSAVRKALDLNDVKQVTLVGHSLGAALALLDSVYLPLHLPEPSYQTFGYGLPRVGNQAFADYVDNNVSLQRVNNKQDIVPILPGEFLGFVHPQGEKHIQDDLSWIDCSGQDNESSSCSTGDVLNIFEGTLRDHHGPYDGIEMGCT